MIIIEVIANNSIVEKVIDKIAIVNNFAIIDLAITDIIS